MVTNEALLDRFAEIDALECMGEGEVVTSYGLCPGFEDVNSFRKATIRAICRLSVAELKDEIAWEQERQAKKSSEPST